MSWSDYVALVSQVPLLKGQLEAAQLEVERSHSGREMLTITREAETVIADGRATLVATLERSQSSLIEMGLSRLPEGMEIPSPSSPPISTAAEALEYLTQLIERTMQLSVRQAQLLADFRRVQGIAARLEVEEERERQHQKQVAAKAEQKRREEEDEHRRRTDARAQLSNEISNLEVTRNELAGQLWRPSKKRRLSEIDAEIRKLRDRRESI